MSKAFHVPVVIDAVDWDAGRVWLEASALRPDLPFDQLCKSPDYTLLALDQESLITAARARFQELGEENPWWIVDVYVTTSGPSTATLTPLAWLLTQIKVTLDLLIRSLFARFEKISTKNDFPATGASTKVFVSTKARLVGVVIKSPRTSGGRSYRASLAAEKPTTCVHFLNPWWTDSMHFCP
jgi:hypothetical protein